MRRDSLPRVRVLVTHVDRRPYGQATGTAGIGHERAEGPVPLSERGPSAELLAGGPFWMSFERSRK